MNGPLRPEALAGEVGCIERWPDETPCGACQACITAMTNYLAGRAEYEHGSPSDLYPA